PSCWTYYSSTAGTTASIGLASTNGYLSVTPSGDAATTSKTKANNSVNLASNLIDPGTLYTFCIAGIYGDESEGGTKDMATGDSLLKGEEIVLSSSKTYKPFKLLSPCSGTFTYTISGPAAGDYSISPSGGSLPQ